MVQEKPFFSGFQVLVYYLVSGKNQETFFQNNFPRQPICLEYILAILEGKLQDKAYNG